MIFFVMVWEGRVKRKVKSDFSQREGEGVLGKKVIFLTSGQGGLAKNILQVAFTYDDRPEALI